MKPTGPKLTLVLFLVALAGYVFVVAPKLPVVTNAADQTAPYVVEKPRPTDSSGEAQPAFFPPDGKKFIGVTTKEGVFDLAPVEAFQKAIKHQPTVMMFNEGWDVHKFSRTPFDRIARRGMLPMLSWEPWNYKDDRTDDKDVHAVQPEYSLAKIYGGEYDKYIESYAKGIKDLKYEVAIRLAHEMNGFWYPWGYMVNGNRSGEYIKMWKHVRGIFERVGTDNVTWVWSANVNFGTNIKLKDFYPGDSQVDWVGLSGYYGTAGTDRYRTPASVFTKTIRELRTFTNRPIVITETAGTNVSGFKARWVNDLFAYISEWPDILGFIWYEAVKETDWRLVATPEASSAFAKQVNAAPYDLEWSGDMLPNVKSLAKAAKAAPSKSSRGGG